MKNWSGKKVLILGFSKSGISAAKYLAQKGANCYITEKKPLGEKLKEQAEQLKQLGVKLEFENHSDNFIANSDIAITSPGIPPHSDLIKRIRERNIPIISEIELAYLETDTPFIAITGTNGKTTTTSLISHILSKKYKAPVCGNIGIPPTSLLNDKNDYLVVELSSFQIEYCSQFKAKIAMFLNFTPDHIDWHGGLENYFSSKAKIFKEPEAPEYAIFNALDKKLLEFSKTSDGITYSFGKEFSKTCCYEKNGAIYFKENKEEKIIDIKDIPLVGEHNYQNVMAAIITAKIIGLDNDTIRNAVKDFKAVEHRCEFVTTKNNISFYNDSKATNPEASIVAIRSFKNRSVTLIAGGRDKMTGLDEFCDSIKECIKDTILIGEAADRFEKALRKNNYERIYRADSLEKAIDKSVELGNEICLLSPACASFDMFDNYEVRGEVFKDYVTTKI